MSQENCNLDENKTDLIKRNEKYFKFFDILPPILTFISIFTFFILGIVVSLALENALVEIVIWLLGAVISFVMYFSLRISFSATILQISYLRIVASKNLELKNTKEETEVSTKTT